MRERLVEGRLVVARVDVDLGPVDGRPEARRVVVRERVGRQEVAPPDLGGIHAQLVGEEVHRPLDDVGRLGPAGAAVGVDERRVRVDAGDLAEDVGDLVAAGEDPAVERGGDARSDRGEAPAEVGVGLDLEARDLAGARRGQLQVRDVVAPVDRAPVALAAALDPLHRPAADRLAGEQREGHVGVAEDLRPEGAADVGRDAAELVLGDSHREDPDEQALDVRRLARHPDRVLVGARVVPADVAAGLHRVGDQALVHQALADDHLRAGEGGVRAGPVAHGPLEDHVVGRVLVELRGARLGRLLGVHDRRQRLPVHADRVERLDRLLASLGDDRGDALAGPLDAVGGEDPRRVDVVAGSRRRRRPARPSAAGCTGCRRR